MKVSNEPVKAMPNSLTLPGTWALLRETIALLTTYPGHFFGYSGWLLVPVVLSVLASTILPSNTHAFADIILNDIAYVILALWAILSILLFTVRTIRKQVAEDAQINSQAWSLILPYAILSFAASFLNLLGLVLFIVPGVIFWVWFNFTGTSFAVGDAGLGNAFKKSRSLSQGRFWDVFARLFQGSLLISLAYACLLIPIILFFSPEGTLNLTTYLNTVPSLGEQLCYNALDILFLPLSVAFQSVLYCHLTATASDGQSTENG